MKSRMAKTASALLKREFLKKWMKGLQIYSNFKKEMTVLERKKAIKLSADIAIASTRNATTHWSQALMASLSNNVNGANKIVVEQILGDRKVEYKKVPLTIITCSKKIVRRIRLARRVVHDRRRCCCRPSVSTIVKKLVKNRTRVLKSLVPGGEQMDEISLIKETLDYIASLQVQVDVMRHLAAAAERLDPSQRSL